ncbi:MAG TPA: glutathione S-transferase family protein [Candidatus Binatia bacterium]|nr:glutathione S-transferase family protein [Candidatus Binatia bacterium]
MTDTLHPYRFIAAERSYFSGKVRPALRAKRVYFEEVLPTPAAMAEIKQRTGLHFIPIVVTPENETWQDTSDILDALDARIPAPALIPTTPVQRVVSYLVELYADEFMLLPAMHYRWSTPEGKRDATDSFIAASGDRDAALELAKAMSGILPALGVGEATIPAIEAHFFDLLACLEVVFTDQPFLLGEQMSLADCALLGPLYAHLYLDYVPGRIVRERAPRTSHWIERMNHPVPGDFRGFRGGDELHPGLVALLALVGRDAGPVVLDTVRDFEKWADAHDDDGYEPPRATGFHETQLRGITMPRYTNAYTLWMLQRPLDAYRALDTAGRAGVDRALADTGCDALLAYAPRHRLEKRNYRLVCRRLLT